MTMTGSISKPLSSVQGSSTSTLHGTDSKPDQAYLTPAPGKDLDIAAGVDEGIVRAEGEERTTAFVWFLVAAAATGGILFGYDVSRT